MRGSPRTDSPAHSKEAGENHRSASHDSDSPAPGIDVWLARRLLEGVGNPAIEIQLWNGSRIPSRALFEEGRQSVGRLVISDWTTLWKLLLDPEFTFGEAYCDGRLRVEGRLEDFLVEVFRNLAGNGASGHNWRLAAMCRWRNGSGLAAARRNIARHYDLGNDFYRLWLDEQLIYTCAYFSDPALTLERAQIAKLDHVCRKLRLRRGERVIEAGCGWGALALHMAREYGARVRAFNISHEQIVDARCRAAEEGLASQVEFIEDDWRNITGEYDAFVSVGMLEHVGLANYDELGRLIQESLLPNGRGLIHTIGLNQPRRLDAWTEQRIFPGAQPPALSQLLQILEPHQLSVLDVENLRLHYALTLRHWRDRFESAATKIREMFDDQFERMWRLYLNSSIASFETGSLQLFQVLFAPAGSNQVARTRAYLYSPQGR